MRSKDHGINSEAEVNQCRGDTRANYLLPCRFDTVDLSLGIYSVASLLGVVIQEELVGVGPKRDAFDFADALVVNVSFD